MMAKVEIEQKLKFFGDFLLKRSLLSLGRENVAAVLVNFKATSNVFLPYIVNSEMLTRL